MAEERTHSRAREQRPSRIPIQNVDVDVDVDVDDEEEEWQDATDINMDEIDDAVDVEENSKKVANVYSFYQSENEAPVCTIY
jgi:hypothetical protein